MAGIPYDAMRPFGMFQNYARDHIGVRPDDPKDVIHAKVVDFIKAHGGNDMPSSCAPSPGSG
jgi:hypothetical protein